MTTMRSLPTTSSNGSGGPVAYPRKKEKGRKKEAVLTCSRTVLKRTVRIGHIKRDQLYRACFAVLYR